LVALAVIVAGPAWLLAGLAALNGQINSFQRVALPGNGEISLTHSGRYVIYYEGPGAAAGNAPALTVGLRPLSASAAVQGITRSSGSGSFSFGHGIRFGSQDFDRKFKVTAPDQEFAARLIDPAMIQWLLSTRGQFGFVIQGSELLVSCDQLPATGLVPLFDAAKSFTDHIPQLVWADYSTSQQNPRDRGTPGEPPA
jgi:hypothetical protein